MRLNGPGTPKQTISRIEFYIMAAVFVELLIGESGCSATRNLQPKNVS